MQVEELDPQAQQKDELYEHYRFVVDPGTELLRIDKYLFNLIRNTSRNKVQQAAKAGCILVNGKAEKQNYKVHPNDVITVLMPDGSCSTNTLHAFEVRPLDVVTVTMARPSATPVSVPSVLTRTTASSSECHVSVVSAPSGVIVGLSASVFPTQ